MACMNETCHHMQNKLHPLPDRLHSSSYPSFPSVHPRRKKKTLKHTIAQTKNWLLSTDNHESNNKFQNMSALAAGRVIVQLFGIRLFCADMGMNWDVKQVAPKIICRKYPVWHSTTETQKKNASSSWQALPITSSVSESDLGKNTWRDQSHVLLVSHQIVQNSARCRLVIGAKAVITQHNHQHSSKHGLRRRALFRQKTL